jgi:hypothetical protein
MLMRQWVMIPLLCASGCVTAIPAQDSAVCDGTRAARADHAAALAATADDRVVVTGARLVALIDAGCKQ